MHVMCRCLGGGKLALISSETTDPLCKGDDFSSTSTISRVMLAATCIENIVSSQLYLHLFDQLFSSRKENLSHLFFIGAVLQLLNMVMDVLKSITL